MSQVRDKIGLMLQGCTHLIVGAGAGMGKDSGLPDYRGDQGLWNHYPPFRGKFNFIQCASPNFLYQYPNLFWGFYGLRLNLYREKQPHQGFNLLHEIGQTMGEKASLANNSNYFVVTSNVDGHFTKAGFPEDTVYEVHGSINHLQCSQCYTIVPNQFSPEVDIDTMNCEELPTCPKCKEITRPNILMFGDWDWISERSDDQQAKYGKFKSLASDKKCLIVQIGCGTGVPTIRMMMEYLYQRNKQAQMISINPDKSIARKWLQDQRYLDLQMGALEGIKLIHDIFQELK